MPARMSWINQNIASTAFVPRIGRAYAVPRFHRCHDAIAIDP